MSNKYLLILEIIWWATGAVSLAVAIRIAAMEGGNKPILFLLMALVSFLFAWLRHKQRKKG
jgi:hypothetical protein